ncbi:hypothetical protein L218DRAFT_594305 [Marasmius fiardii PR-910]|nr:hypothetical protein L218DRAFT_594305 [Marasmius fiardii PR-910]
MPFRVRNPYYLRISASCVLPVFLYLDERHLDWMSDRILQHVLEDLRPNILPKLQAESDAQLGPGGSAAAKKAAVETHRGENYHFCYFLRKTQPHSIVLKTRSFTTVPRKSEPMPPPPVPQKKPAAKRKTTAAKAPSRKKRKLRDEDEYSDANEGLSSEGDEILDDDGDVAMEEGPEDADYEPSSRQQSRIRTVQFTLVPDEEEEKPKPVLNLKYRGFSIYGHCLCIVVEPWPPIRAPSRAPSIFRATPAPPRESTIAPPEFVSEVEARTRSKTPLFLPDIDEYERGITPFTTSRTPMPTGAAKDEDGDDDDDYGGMMQFSQVLNSTGDHRAGAIDEDEDMEGAVLFGDADEYKEL